MKKPTRIAFYVETLLLIGALVAVAVILVRCFGVAEQTRVRAQELTNAVHLARNAAEAAAGAEDSEALGRLLTEKTVTPSETGLFLTYNAELAPDPSGEFLLEIIWDKAPSPGCGLVNYTISVEHIGKGYEVYSMKTAVYLGEGTQ